MTHAFHHGNPARHSKSGSSQSLGSSGAAPQNSDTLCTPWTRVDGLHGKHSAFARRVVAFIAPIAGCRGFSQAVLILRCVSCQALERLFCPFSNVSSTFKVPVLHVTAMAVTAAQIISCLRLSHPDLLCAV